MFKVEFSGKVLESFVLLMHTAAAYLRAATPGAKIAAPLPPEPQVTTSTAATSLPTLDAPAIAEPENPKASPPPQAEPPIPRTPGQAECAVAVESTLAAEALAAAVAASPPPPAKRSRAGKKPEPEPEPAPTTPPETVTPLQPEAPEPVAEAPGPVAEAPEPIAETPPALVPEQDAPAVDTDPDGWPTMLTRPPATCEAAELRGWMAQNLITDAELTAAQYKLFQKHRDIISLPSMHMAVKKLGPERWYIAFAQELAAMRKESGL